jgi:adenosylmethionine-8-amino-7-oxononanoate aminotransferase
VADGVCGSEAGVFMHGPTFMANPLAAAVSLASVNLLLETPFIERVAHIEQRLRAGLGAVQSLDNVADVRVKGAIGVVELKKPVDMTWIEAQFVDRGVWIRPFGKLVYLMPPLIIGDADVATLTTAVCEVVAKMATRG